MSSLWAPLGAVLAGLAVVCGAFAAHGLNDHFSRKYAGETRTVFGAEIPLAQKYLADFKTAAEYQMYHALGLIAVGLLAASRPGASVSVAGWSFLLGIVLFSGSLYVLTLTGQRWLGAVTPLGGVLFIVGWAALALATLPRSSP